MDMSCKEMVTEFVTDSLELVEEAENKILTFRKGAKETP